MNSEMLSPLDNKLRRGAWVIAALVLCVPLVAMRFTAEVDWTLGDFVVAAAIIGGIGLMAEFLVRVSRDGWYRAGSACALAAVFLTVWSNLAVGIIGNENNPYNLWYFGLVPAAIVGAALARFRAGGMALVALGGLVTLAVLGLAAPDEPIRVWPQTAFLAAPWALAAAFFGNAARERVSTSLDTNG